MGARPLAGKVVIVPVGDGSADLASAGLASAGLAPRLAAEGATVVLVASGDALEEAGRLASHIQSQAAGRPAVFALEPDDPGTLDALDEFVAELFP